MKNTEWSTGTHLYGEKTNNDDGVHSGFDADWGEMYALGGKLIPESELPKRIKKKPNLSDPQQEKLMAFPSCEYCKQTGNIYCQNPGFC